MNATIEHALARIATRQYGIVSREQLLAVGLSPSTIDRWARIGRLHRVHRGIYAVGHTATRRQAAYVAAVLAAGPGAALSHVSAAAWWEIRPWAHGRIHITVPTANGRRGHRGVVLHRARTLRPDEVTAHDGLAVTTVARTLLDVAATQPRHILDRAVEVATDRRLVHADIHDVIAAHPTTANTRTLMKLLAYHGDSPQRRRSDFEAYVVDLCRTHGLPLPQTDVPLLGEVVDCYWPEHRVVAEPDGMTWHGTRAAARRDRSADGARIASGIITVRITDEMAQQDGRATAAAIRGAMRR